MPIDPTTLHTSIFCPTLRKRNEMGCRHAAGEATMVAYSGEPSSLDGDARFGKTGHKERAPWLVG
jgi:hypothetical protein